jgi:hypothetical protein
MTSFLYFYRILKKHVHIDKESKMIHRKNSSVSNLQQSRIGFSCPPFLMLIVQIRKLMILLNAKEKLQSQQLLIDKKKTALICNITPFSNIKEQYYILILKSRRVFSFPTIFFPFEVKKKLNETLLTLTFVVSPLSMRTQLKTLLGFFCTDDSFRTTVTF